MHGLRKQWEKFHAITWPKVFCKVADTQLNLDLQLLAIGTETMRERSADCCPLCLSTITLLAEATERMVCPPLSHCNSELDEFTSGSTWRGAQICGGYIHASNGQCRVRRASLSFLSGEKSKSKCYPSGLKTNARSLLSWKAERKEEEGGLRWRPGVRDVESCVACFCSSPDSRMSKMVRSHIWHNHGSARPSPAQQRVEISGAVPQQWSHHLLNSPSWCLRSLCLLWRHPVLHAMFLGGVTPELALK